eukprot:jgi/Ulvmu1/2254/UM013_0101.1
MPNQVADTSSDGPKRPERVRKLPQRLRDDSNASGSSGSSGTQAMRRLQSDATTTMPDSGASFDGPTPAAPAHNPAHPTAAAAAADTPAQPTHFQPTRKRSRMPAAAAPPSTTTAPTPIRAAPSDAVSLPGVPVPFVQRGYAFIPRAAAAARTDAQRRADEDAHLAVLHAQRAQHDAFNSTAVPPLTHFIFPALSAATSAHAKRHCPSMQPPADEA